MIDWGSNIRNNAGLHWLTQAPKLPAGVPGPGLPQKAAEATKSAISSAPKPAAKLLQGLRKKEDSVKAAAPKLPAGVPTPGLQQVCSGCETS